MRVVVDGWSTLLETWVFVSNLITSVGTRPRVVKHGVHVLICSCEFVVAGNRQLISRRQVGDRWVVPQFLGRASSLNPSIFTILIHQYTMPTLMIMIFLVRIGQILPICSN